MMSAMFDVKALQGSTDGPRSILRVLQVLSCLAQHPEGRTLAQLCEDLALPRTTLFTMLKVLTGSGHLQCTSGTYSLAAQAVMLGSAIAASARRSFPDCANEVLDGLCKRTGETGFLAVLTSDGMNCRYVAVIESENSLRFSVTRDSLKPAYATGTGRAMLAYLPDADVQAMLERVRFEKLTGKTIASKRALMAALKEVRARQVSTVDSGTVSGVISVAAPIFDANGRVLAAVSAGGPASRVESHLPAIERAVRGAAEDISRILGFTAEWPALPAER